MFSKTAAAIGFMLYRIYTSVTIAQHRLHNVTKSDFAQNCNVKQGQKA